MTFKVGETTNSGADEAARLLFSRPWIFVKGCVDVQALPPPIGVDVCFAGRSNVGKSSLINALVNRKDLARISNTPGRTQELNIFMPQDQAQILQPLYIVDLPGYGFARAPKAKVDIWTRLIHNYLRGRPTLRRAFVLIDSRHGPKKNDAAILEIMDRAAVSYQIVLTKTDKLKNAELDRAVSKTHDFIAKRPAAHPNIMLTSAQSGRGIQAVRRAIYDFLPLHESKRHPIGDE